jgi:hypothetical protein
VPRCQRTFRRIRAEDALTKEERGLLWVCPYCPEQETYEAITAHDLLQYAQQAERQLHADFGTPDDSHRSFRLFLGLRPECVLEPDEESYAIYLQHGSDPYQMRLQIGHEMFHRVCSQGNVFHWTHEMLACLVSVRLLNSFGIAEYAVQTDKEYQRQSQFCSLAEMLTADLTAPVYPTGLYGRAYVTGKVLQEIVGWSTLCLLVRNVHNNRIPDIHQWLKQLPEAQRQVACQILPPYIQ